MRVRLPVARPLLGAAALLLIPCLPAAAARSTDVPPVGDVTIRYADDASGAVRVLRCSSGVCTVSGLADLPSFRLGSDGAARVTDRVPAPVPKNGICGGFSTRRTTSVEATVRTLRVRTTLADAQKSCSGGTARLVGFTTTVTATSLEPVGTPTPPPAAAPQAAGSAPPPGDADRTTSRLATGEAAAPSVLSALPTVQDAAPDAGQSVTTAVLVVVLVLLVAFPTHLLNTAVDTGHGRLVEWWRGRDPAAGTDGPTPRTWARAAACVLAASLVAALSDPGLGLNGPSARTVVSILVSLALESVVVWLVVIALVRRLAPGVTATFTAAPSTLLVVAGAVVLTRATGFEPAIVFGLVAGVAFGAATSRADQGRVVLAGASLAFVLALLGWVTYSVVDAGDDASFPVRLLSETASSLAIAGIASLPLALVPLRGLSGHALFAWDRRVWAVAYALGLVGFFLVLMPMPFSWSGVDASLATWVGLYVAYALVAVAVWAAVVRPWRRDPVAGAA